MNRASAPPATTRARLWPTSDRGSASAEFAMVLPAIVLVVLIAAGAGAVGLTQLRAYEAARAGARESARGEPVRDVKATAEKKAGKTSRATIAQVGEYTRVTVEIPLPTSLHFIRSSVSASADARTEGVK